MESEKLLVDTAIQRAAIQRAARECDAWRSIKKKSYKALCNCSKLVGHVGHRWKCSKCDRTYSG